MDPISQGALGASWAQATTASRAKLALAGIVGSVSGMAPDIDVVFRSSTDPLFALEFHRHFTHSLIFIPLGAFVCAVLMKRFTKKWLSFKETYLFSLLGYGSHGLLDACTTYGTLLFWPFSNVRIAWNNVSVVDPLFTVPIIVLVVMAARRRRRMFALAAVVWAVAYLSFGLAQTNRASSIAQTLAATRGHTPNMVVATPAIASLVLWKTIYEFNGRYYVDAVRIAWSERIYEGSSVAVLSAADHLPWLESSSQQARDLARFEHFARGLLGVDPNNSNRIVDMRYSMLPNDIDGLWAIILDPDAASETHVRFATDTAVPPGRARALYDMLF